MSTFSSFFCMIYKFMSDFFTKRIFNCMRCCFFCIFICYNIIRNFFFIVIFDNNNRWFVIVCCCSNFDNAITIDICVFFTIYSNYCVSDNSFVYTRNLKTCCTISCICCAIKYSKCRLFLNSYTSVIWNCFFF